MQLQEQKEGNAFMKARRRWCNAQTQAKEHWRCDIERGQHYSITKTTTYVEKEIFIISLLR